MAVATEMLVREATIECDLWRDEENGEEVCKLIHVYMPMKGRVPSNVQKGFFHSHEILITMFIFFYYAPSFTNNKNKRGKHYPLPPITMTFPL